MQKETKKMTCKSDPILDPTHVSALHITNWKGCLERRRVTRGFYHIPRELWTANGLISDHRNDGYLIRSDN